LLRYARKDGDCSSALNSMTVILRCLPPRRASKDDSPAASRRSSFEARGAMLCIAPLTPRMTGLIKAGCPHDSLRLLRSRRCSSASSLVIPRR
jgi:hypothetical protein